MIGFTCTRKLGEHLRCVFFRDESAQQGDAAMHDRFPVDVLKELRIRKER